MNQDNTVRDPRCWCGNRNLVAFSTDYLRCMACNTLVVSRMHGEQISYVENDEKDFYGKSYYLRHVQEKYGFPNLETRARADMTERCLHWLRTVLALIRLPSMDSPPVRTLELGSAHGGFVAMLRWAGFEATGLELSPWLTSLASDWFAVPMLTGRLEDQRLPPGSLDAVILMDVLEHLPNPQATMEAAIRLLNPGGFLLVQTPCFPHETPDLATMEAANHPFLQQLKPLEHIYLFSKPSVSKLFASLGLNEIRFEPAIFSHYDMFFAASSRKLSAREEIEWTDYLSRGSQNPSGRSLLAILDATQERDRLANLNRHIETEATSRLVVIEEQARVIEEQARQLAISESDRAARLVVIEEQARQLAISESDRAARLAVIQEQGRRLAEMDELRGVIDRQGARLDKLERERADVFQSLVRVKINLKMTARRRVAQLLKHFGVGLDSGK